jgi:hypothetical protein
MHAPARQNASDQRRDGCGKPARPWLRHRLPVVPAGEVDDRPDGDARRFQIDQELAQALVTVAVLAARPISSDAPAGMVTRALRNGDCALVKPTDRRPPAYIIHTPCAHAAAMPADEFEATTAACTQIIWKTDEEGYM